MEKPKYKIVFVDFDGVICTARAQICLKDPLAIVPPRGNIDPVAVGMINRLCEVTGAKIVISSSWRADSSLHRYLQNIGFPYRNQYEGPNSRELWRIPYAGGVQRGIEIDQWLEAASKVIEVERYVMLDDDRDFLEHQMPNLIWCSSSSDGLSCANYFEAEKILGGETWKRL